MKKYKIAAILILIHGGFIEIGGGLAMLPFVFNLKIPFLMNGALNAESAFSFIVPYLQENLPLMLVMGVIFGVARIVGAVGLLKNRMWGLALSVINCVVTMALCIFMLPAGIIDAILAITPLTLMLMGYFGKQKLVIGKR